MGRFGLGRRSARPGREGTGRRQPVRITPVVVHFRGDCLKGQHRSIQFHGPGRLPLQPAIVRLPDPIDLIPRNDDLRSIGEDTGHRIAVVGPRQPAEDQDELVGIRSLRGQDEVSREIDLRWEDGTDR